MNITLSLKAKITIVFVFLFLLLILSLIPFRHMQEMKAQENMLKYYELLAQHIRENRLPPSKLVAYMKKMNFTTVHNPQMILAHNGADIIRKNGFEAISVDDIYYIHIITPFFRILLKDTMHKYEQNYLDIFIFVLFAVLFAFIYYLILKNINDTQHQLKSRQLFLRTIMHELKTPIAKGRIVSELINDEKQKGRIITIFEKLNVLIDDFAKVEQIVSRNYELKMQYYTISRVMFNAIEMLLVEKTDNIILQDISEKKIYIDFELFSLAIKNLLDNALKYSRDTKVIVKEEFNQLLIISNGKELQNPLQEYFKPFHTDVKNKNHGMGLGLYIVHSILQMQSMHLEYTYKDKQNIFKIILP